MWPGLFEEIERQRRNESKSPQNEEYYETMNDDFDSDAEEPSFAGLEPSAERTCMGRFRQRRLDWLHTCAWFPMTRHHFWWLLHNNVAHLLLGFLPFSIFIKFHDYTSHKLNQSDELINSPMPIFNNILSYLSWLFHNSVIHTLIGLLPITWFFTLHDRSASLMDQPDWV